MRIPRWSRRRASVAGACALAAGLAVAGCSSASSGTAVPQGLSGGEASQSAGGQYASEQAAAATVLAPAAGSFLAGKTTVSVLGSTTPANGDINPYAIWPVTTTAGSVSAGDVLVDNFNNASNNQGTGTTIVDLHPDGHRTVFAAVPSHVAGCPGGVGLTTAMVQLRTGWVIVGSLPSSTGQVSSAGAGCLLILSPAGKLAGTISGSYIDGPWDATVRDNGATATLFVSNTLRGIGSGTAEVDQGDVVRISLAQSESAAPKVTGETVIAGGFPERASAAAFVQGPTGLALGSSGTLYVADSLGNRIAAVPGALSRATSAGNGTTLSQGRQLANPLGLVLAPDGDLLAANAINGKIVEITPAGRQVGEYYADNSVGQEPPGNGDLFDLAISRNGVGVLFVNDGTNTLELLH
jgi:hypothetical protein